MAQIAGNLHNFLESSAQLPGPDCPRILTVLLSGLAGHKLLLQLPSLTGGEVEYKVIFLPLTSWEELLSHYQDCLVEEAKDSDEP